MAAACKVVVGSLNPVKVNAVRRAFRLLCDPVVKGTKVVSGVSAQPIGLREILLGALNRATQALKAEEADYGVGIEAGAIVADAGPIEIQVAVISDRSSRVSIGLSQGFMLPLHWLDELLDRVELEEIVTKTIRRRDVGEKLGFIGYLTYGLVTRTELSYNAVLMALVPRLNPNLYSRLPRAQDIIERLSERT